MGFFRGTANFLSFGSLDRKDAKLITRYAQGKEADSREELEKNRNRTHKAIEDLGELKARIYLSTISDFSNVYENVGKVDLKPFSKTDEQLSRKTYKKSLTEMKKVTAGLKEIGVIAGGGAVGGAVAVGGAMGFATLIGTASTGTAIGSLSGVAATNATLAWLGGGAISAGGAGVAGGMVVLGGVALAPFAVFGMFMGTKKGQQKLNVAMDHLDEVDALIEKIRTLIAELSQIRRGIHLFNDSIIALNNILQLKIEDMSRVVVRLNERSMFSQKVIDPIKKVFNIDILTEAETQIVVDTTNAASLLKQLIEKPLLDGEGAFLSEALNFLEQKQEIIALMKQDSTI